jgi:uncharacterized RDD family membrane protein YckC
MGSPGADAASADLIPKAAEPPVQAEKADLPRRLAAALVDLLLAGALWMVPLAGPFLAALYLLVRDGIELPMPMLERRSAGKKLVGLCAIRLDGAPLDVPAAIQRNVLIAACPVLPLVPWVGWFAPFFSFAFAAAEVAVYFADGEGQRLGDRIARTQVIVEPPERDARRRR